jgi:predicted benzoate:H+ symporter BenE
MVMVRDFEFSLRELAGGLGDLGTFIPFTIGYIVFSGFDATGIMVGFGVTHILLALVYRLPLPLQPMKVIGSLALAEGWEMSRVLGAGFSMGIITTAISSFDNVNRAIQKIPDNVVKGIILSLGLKLMLRSVNLVSDNLLLTGLLVSASIILLSVEFVPSSIFLVLFGFTYAVYMGDLDISLLGFELTLPKFQVLILNDIVVGFLSTGLVQTVLTITNAVLATTVLIRDLYPNKPNVTPKKLFINMGAINLVSPFIGGIPMCHGAGGLSAHYLFGAKTGGAILMLGVIELFMGLFLSQSLLSIFSSFPVFVVGVMLLLTSFELMKGVWDVKGMDNVAVILVTLTLSIWVNYMFGAIVGTCAHFLMMRKSPEMIRKGVS